MSPASPDQIEARSGAWVLVAYTAAVFLSALLLFGVQPMFTRMVLPQLGGSPAVWSVAMVFFQSMLLAGYAYAHWLMRAPTRVLPVLVHLTLLVAAGLTLPLSIAKNWGEPPAAGLEFWLLGLFAVSIGLPFFALAANNPLLQAWFVRTGHRDGKDPYFLYAASNIGSFLALLSYPIVLEPVFTLQAQNWLWSGGFALLIVLIAGCAYLLLRAPPGDSLKDADANAAPSPPWPLIGRWVFVSAVPSGLLVAITVFISTDVAAAPLMWVIPLSLYLLTWVIVFARRPLLPQKYMLLLQPFAVAAIVALMLYNQSVTIVPNLGGHLLAFFVIAMACHGELARSRPAPAHLTVFYVSLSFGGMLGGLFSGLLAPYTFSWVAEYPILLVLAVLCRPFAGFRWQAIEPWFWPVAILVVLQLMLPGFFGFHLTSDMTTSLNAVVLVLLAVSILFLFDPPKSAVAVALALALMRFYPTDEGRSETVRSFFGVLRIFETPDRDFRVLMHGSTVHGAQRLLTADGEPVTGRPDPLTYYHDNSPLAHVIDAVRARKGAPLRVAVIGLGAGSLACRIEKDETWRFFEIDPLVIEVARDPRRFTFLSSCAPDLPIVLGDARLTLAREPTGFYDLIVVDAYSSDAIPVHLATREAMAIYKAKLAPHGVVAMHISNRHLELESVAVGIAAANGLKTWVWNSDDETENDDNYIYRSDVAIAAENPDDIGELAKAKTWVPTEPNPAVRTWTDDYSNIAGAFWRRYIQ
ncbi:MAG TPA: fused MFS/spermidine synthase [Pseudolabrys sp.]